MTVSPDKHWHIRYTDPLAPLVDANQGKHIDKLDILTLLALFKVTSQGKHIDKSDILTPLTPLKVSSQCKHTHKSNILMPLAP